MKQVSFFVVIAFLLGACAPSAALSSGNTNPPDAMNNPAATPPMGVRSSLPDMGAAPELTNSTWLNVNAPLRLANLRGKVVLLDMWTFECINCQHVLPALRGWHAKYASSGRVVIGNHFPEFSQEANRDNLKAAVNDDGILYPVAQDNDGATWKAYKNEYWPAMYLIDKSGHIRYVQIGEGNYFETEAAIQALLAEPTPQS